MNQWDIRVELAAMTDDEVLVWARRKSNNPYMNLARAKEWRNFTFKWMHLDAAAMVRKHGREKALSALHAHVFVEESHGR